MGVCVDWRRPGLGPTLLLSLLLGSDPTLAQPLSRLVASTWEVPPVVSTHTVSPSWKHPGSPSPVRPQPCSGGVLLGHSWDCIAPHGLVPKAAQDSILISCPRPPRAHLPALLASPLSSLPKPSASISLRKSGETC